MTQAAAQFDVTGVVVRVADLKESHRVIELLTPTHGRVSLLARGGRASRRRFAGALDLFVALRAQGRAGRGLWTLESVDVHTAHAGVRTRLELIERASVVCECARLLTNEHQPAPRAHAALLQALGALDRGDLAAAADAYPRLLAAAGIAPDGDDALSAPALAVWRGAPCAESPVADEVERAAVSWAQAHVGVVLRSFTSGLLAGASQRNLVQ